MKFEVVWDSVDHITHEAVAQSATSIIEPGSVLMVVRSGILARTVPVAIAGRSLALNQDLKALCPGPSIDSKFLYYLLESKMTELLALVSRGATVHRLITDQIRDIEFRLPSLNEQRRIVAILDEAFEGIATAKAHAEKNLRNAREIFESHLDAVFIRGGSDWANMNLGDACELENGDRGKNYPSRDEYVKSGIPWINTGHIRADGTLSIEEMNFISPEKFQSLRSGKIQAGDLVYCLRGATLGKTAVVAPLIQGAVASSLVIIRPARFLDSWFLYFFLTSPYGQGLIKGFENGAAQPNLGARSVAKYPISIPPAEEQLRIVEFLAGARDESRHLADLYQRKLAALDELKQSLLHQAFSGQL